MYGGVGGAWSACNCAFIVIFETAAEQAALQTPLQLDGKNRCPRLLPGIKVVNQSSILHTATASQTSPVQSRRHSTCFCCGATCRLLHRVWLVAVMEQRLHQWAAAAHTRCAFQRKIVAVSAAGKLAPQSCCCCTCLVRISKQASSCSVAGELAPNLAAARAECAFQSITAAAAAEGGELATELRLHVLGALFKAR